MDFIALLKKSTLAHELSQPRNDGFVFLQDDKRRKVREDLFGVELATLPNEDSVDIEPVFFARSEGLVHNEVFCGAGAKRKAVWKFPKRGSLHRVKFKIHCAQGNIQTYPVRCFKQKNAASPGEFVPVRYARFESRKQPANDFLIVLNVGKDGGVGILRHANFAPALQTPGRR